VTELCTKVDALLVVGAANSSNSQRLVDVARTAGTPAWLVPDASTIQQAWFDGAHVVGLTSGASAPEHLVEEVCAWFRERGTTTFRQDTWIEERMRFAPPPQLTPA
jgi:4-hydroxy-3-methylbut-2-enyl diphosphate reductase